MNTEKFDALVDIAKTARPYAKRLAVSIGNYRGTNDFSGKRPTLVDGFLLNELRNDLIAMVVVRAWALVSPSNRSTDRTLHVAAARLKDPGVQSEVIQRSQAWTFPNEDIASARRHQLQSRIAAFSQIMDELDTVLLRDYRNWVLAHVTVNPTPRLQLGTAMRVAEQALEAFDHLEFIVRGDYPDVVGLSRIRREQSLHFWEHFKPEYISTAQNGVSFNDTGNEIS